MRARAARQIRAGIVAAREVLRSERVARAYNDETLFGQAYRYTIREYWIKNRLWREADKWR